MFYLYSSPVKAAIAVKRTPEDYVYFDNAVFYISGY